MTNKLLALRCFCTAAKELHFRKTAVRLGVSPQVVTRLISELEEEIGEILFKRNSRNYQLTPFGQEFFQKAEKFLQDADKLFLKKNNKDDLSGTVRITLPRLPFNCEIIQRLFLRLEKYPDIAIDWIIDQRHLNWTEYQIDIGIRVGKISNDNFIVRKIAEHYEYIIAAPKLIAKYGLPKDLEDLKNNYPLGSEINRETGRPWQWVLNNQEQFIPNRPMFLSADVYSEYAAVLAGRICALTVDFLCEKDIQEGKIIRLLPEIISTPWDIYIYRPYQNIVPKRVQIVFDALTDALQEIYSDRVIF